MSAFLGMLAAATGAIPSVALTNHTVSSDIVSTVTFANDGTLVLYDGVSATVAGEWLSCSPATVSSAVAGGFDIQFTYVSGANTHSGSAKFGGADKSGAAYATWLNLATSQSITLSAFAGWNDGTGAGSVTFDVEIRPAGGGAILATARILLAASIV